MRRRKRQRHLHTVAGEMHSCWVSTVSAVVPSRRADSAGGSAVSASRPPGVRAPVADGLDPCAQEAKRVYAFRPDAIGGKEKGGAKEGKAAKVVSNFLSGFLKVDILSMRISLGMVIKLIDISF